MGISLQQILLTAFKADPEMYFFSVCVVLFWHSFFFFFFFFLSILLLVSREGFTPWQRPSWVQSVTGINKPTHVKKRPYCFFPVRGSSISPIWTTYMRVLPEASLSSLLCVCKQQRLWRDCTNEPLLVAFVKISFSHVLANFVLCGNSVQMLLMH